MACNSPLYIPARYAQIVPESGVVDWADGLPWERHTHRRRELFTHDQNVVPLPLVYSYTKKNRYTSRAMSPVVARILAELNGDGALAAQLGMKRPIDLNVCFLNRYDNDRNGLGWHADDEPALDDEQPIVVVSFGATRALGIRPKGSKGAATATFMLEHGSILVMPPGFQETHEHQIPGHPEPIGTRVSLTYRKMEVPPWMVC